MFWSIRFSWSRSLIFLLLEIDVLAFHDGANVGIVGLPGDDFGYAEGIFAHRLRPQPPDDCLQAEALEVEHTGVGRATV